MESNITEEQLNRFIEIGNKAMDNASLSLTKLTGHSVDVETVQGVVIPPHVLTEQLGVADDSTTTVAFKISSALNGFAWLMMSEQHAKQFVKELLEGQNVTEPDQELKDSVLKESANIVVGSMLTQLSESLQGTIEHSIPDIVTDMLKATLDELCNAVASNSNDTLAFVTSVEINPMAINASIVLLLEAESAEKFIETV